MDVGTVGYGSALTPEVQAQYAIKCIKMAEQTAYAAGNIIQDTAEISEEAMAMYATELSAGIEQ